MILKDPNCFMIDENLLFQINATNYKVISAAIKLMPISLFQLLLQSLDLIGDGAVSHQIMAIEL